MSTVSPLRFPAARALLAQGLALLIMAVVVWGLATLFSTRLPIWLAAIFQGLVAAAIGDCLGLRRWWLPINLIFVPGLLALQSCELPSVWLLAAFVALLLVNWNSFREQVPLYLSGKRTRQQLCERLASLPANFRFIDLGCGLGATLVEVARRYPQSQVVGVETAPLVFLFAWLRCLPVRNCTVRYRSLWDENLQPYDVVYCFLSPAPMPRLWRKSREQMRNGALLVSNSFAIPEVAAHEVIELNDWRDSRLLIWRL